MSVTPIVALDFNSLGAALSLVERLRGAAQFFKVGSELFTRAGPEIVSALHARHCEVFLDLKFHDIPNTVANAVAAAADMGVAMTTVHAAGGPAMLQAAARAATPSCLVLGVTVLTSLDAQAVAAVWGRDGDVEMEREVLRLARVASDGGLGGLVCSGHEAGPVRNAVGNELKLVVPGVRFADASAADDQTRVVTPAKAARAGADFVVIGRPITTAADPAAAFARLKSELAGWLEQMT
ncbi:MAG: orotidine-5'-phosphate decarboxylase [Gemmatimonadaceae bacterium]